MGGRYCILKNSRVSGITLNDGLERTHGGGNCARRILTRGTSVNMVCLKRVRHNVGVPDVGVFVGLVRTLSVSTSCMLESRLSSKGRCMFSRVAGGLSGLAPRREGATASVLSTCVHGLWG